MTQDIITQADLPSHKLTVKLEDGTFRIFRLNKRQAEFIVTRINSVEQFIVLPRDIDPSAPTAYPKRGAWVEKLTDEELQVERDKYAYQFRLHVETEEEAANRERSQEIANMVQQWVKEHPKEFKELKENVFEEMKSRKSLFHIASKNTKLSLVHYESLRRVYEKMENTTGENKGSCNRTIVE